jgi:sulfoxide reductase heme-binding subunit YedZ
MIALDLSWLTQGAALWYLNRATGLVDLVLFTLVVVGGILATSRRTPAWWPRFGTVSLHRTLSLLALALLVVHIVSAVFDKFVDLTWMDTVVPFASSYRPFWLGLGTLAFDLFLAVLVTSLLRFRIGPTAWRSVHLLAYAAWPIAVVHGLGTGTDASTLPVLALTFACVGLVAVAAAWRVTTVPIPLAARVALFAVVALLPLWLSGWVRLGPLDPSWAQQAQHAIWNASILSTGAPHG